MAQDRRLTNRPQVTFSRFIDSVRLGTYVRPQSTSIAWPGRMSALACAFVLLSAVAIAQPQLEMGVNDDWSYIWIARDLFQTGHVHYNGWASSILGWQLYWGALFFKIYGFSFAVARMSVLCIALAITVLLERLMVRLGLSEGNAVLGTLAFVLSPLFFPLAFSFMSDIPGLFAFVVCLYAVVRALQAHRDWACFGWIFFAAASNVGLGTVRQISWLGALVLVPTAACMLRGRRYMIPFAAALWVASVAVIAGSMHWFHQAPYTLSEALVPGAGGLHRVLKVGMTVTRSMLAISLLLLPVLIGFLARVPPRLRNRPHLSRRLIWLCGLLPFALLAPVTVHGALNHQPQRWLTPFSNNTVTARGLVDLPDLLGHRPDVIPVAVRLLLLCLLSAAVAATCLWLAQTRWLDRTSRASMVSGFTPRSLLLLVGPYVVCYLALVVSRETLYDRYLLPCLLLAGVLLLRLYQDCIRSRLPVWSTVCVAVFGCFSVAAMHDLYACGRARLEAAETLVRAGVPRQQLRAGFEYDSWTELEVSGYINDPRVSLPAGAYHPVAAPDPDDRCAYWFSSETPHVHGRYGLAYEPDPCQRASGFEPVEYTTWLAPYDRAIYVQQLPESDTTVQEPSGPARRESR